MTNQKHNYQVLARQYRPQRFCDVLGQKTTVATLKNAIQMKRTAHAYLFCGCRGTGKTTLARLFAKALNCSSLTEDGEPCNSCPSCKDIAAGHAMDVLEIDGASHRGIEDIRQINETIGFTPTTGRYKIYLIDEVHMLTKEAFNALLKTVEEPPTHAKFFFATTEPHKIPTTILSRCQRFNLGRIPFEMIQEKLASIAKDLALSVEEEALVTLAELSNGSLRDAESLFDQVISFQKDNITGQAVAAALGLPSREMLFALDSAGFEGKLTMAFSLASEIFLSGKNISYFLEELLGHFRTLFLQKNGVSKAGPDLKQYQITATRYQEHQLLQILELIAEAQQTMKSAPSERIALEILLLRILRTHQRLTLDGLVERLVQLEKNLHSVPQEPVRMEQSKPTPVVQEAASCSTIQEQSRNDTIMRFAAKELNGSLKKES